MLELNMLFILY